MSAVNTSWSIHLAGWPGNALVTEVSGHEMVNALFVFNLILYDSQAFDLDRLLDHPVTLSWNLNTQTREFAGVITNIGIQQTSYTHQGRSLWCYRVRIEPILVRLDKTDLFDVVTEANLLARCQQVAAPLNVKINSQISSQNGLNKPMMTRYQETIWQELRRCLSEAGYNYRLMTKAGQLIWEINNSHQFWGASRIINNHHILNMHHEQQLSARSQCFYESYNLQQTNWSTAQSENLNQSLNLQFWNRANAINNANIDVARCKTLLQCHIDIALADIKPGECLRIENKKTLADLGVLKVNHCLYNANILDGVRNVRSYQAKLACYFNSPDCLYPNEIHRPLFRGLDRATIADNASWSYPLSQPVRLAWQSKKILTTPKLLAVETLSSERAQSAWPLIKGQNVIVSYRYGSPDVAYVLGCISEQSLAHQSERNIQGVWISTNTTDAQHSWQWNTSTALFKVKASNQLSHVFLDVNWQCEQYFLQAKMININAKNCFKIKSEYIQLQCGSSSIKMTEDGITFNAAFVALN